nr:MAG TPA: hypothetical protein [Caudoviricetes sp.]
MTYQVNIQNLRKFALYRTIFVGPYVHFVNNSTHSVVTNTKVTAFEYVREPKKCLYVDPTIVHTSTQNRNLQKLAKLRLKTV